MQIIHLMKQGHHYALIHSIEELQKAQLMVYAVRLHTRDTLQQLRVPQSTIA